MAQHALWTGVFVFVTSWNEFVIGLTFTTATELRPLPAGISMVFLQEFQYRWPEMMAVATLATLPVLLLFLFFQRSFIRGITAGASSYLVKPFKSALLLTEVSKYLN